MKKKLYTLTIAAAIIAAGGTLTSCSEEGGQTPPAPSTGASTLYVIPAVDGDATYLLTATTLDSGKVSAIGNGTEVMNATYWVYKNTDYAFALVYNKGGAGTGASYYLDSNGQIAEKYTYTYNRITTYGTWGDNVITASTGNSSQADAEGNYPQVLLFNYLNATDGTQEEGTAVAENFLGNGE